MNVKKIIPTGPEFMREALIVLGGALIATVIYRMAPDNVKKWLSFSN